MPAPAACQPSDAHHGTAGRRPGRLRRSAAAVVVAVVCSLLLAVPAEAREECLADGVGDLLDLVTPSTNRSNPRADIHAMCADHRPGRLDLQARLGASSDVATDPAWEEGQSALVFQVDVDPPPPDPTTGQQDLEREYDVVIGRSVGQAAFSVLRADDGSVVCGGPLPTSSLPTDDDPTFRLSVDTAACLPSADGTAPAVVRVGAFMIFTEQGGNPTLDEVPVRDVRYGTRLGTEPRPDAVAFDDVIRLGGDTRIETAIEVSRASFPEPATAGGVVLATGRPSAPAGQVATSSPDALAAAPLATHLNGPLLLVGAPAASGQLPDAVVAEIRRAMAPDGTVHLVGGAAAIDPHVEAELQAAGFTTRRLAGSTREATSLAVAAAIDPEPTRIVLADGSRFEFALLGGAYAAHANIQAAGPDGGPAGSAVLLLTTLDEQGNPALHPVYADYLRTDRPGRQVIAIGQVAAAAAERGGLDLPEQNQIIVPGDDVHETSLALARRYGDDAPDPASVPPPADGAAEPLPGIVAPPDPTSVVVVSSRTFPDAISGGALAGRLSVPLLLSWPDSLPAGTRQHLRSLPNRLNPMFVIGGPAALADAVASQLSICGGLPASDSTPECRPAG